MIAKADKPSGTALREQANAQVVIYGVAEANKLARSGRFISAIKHIEAANPDISREHARAIVHSFGYREALHWPEKDQWPIRCL